MITYFMRRYAHIRRGSHSLFNISLATRHLIAIVAVMIIYSAATAANSSGLVLTYAAGGESFADGAINQQRVSGKVVDEEGNPLQGVTVTVTGETTSVKTDVDGSYSIAAQRGDVLVFSFIGMKQQEIAVEDQGTINVTLEGDAVGIDEVVVIGYGVQKKVSITNAVSSIGSDEISARNSTNVTQALQGKLPGLTVIDRGGAPGGENLTARIRGVTSLNDNNPLVLIDGVPGSLSRVNPADIESVSVLKDAASTAIYGSRASAGVILVTTKAPSDGKLAVSYDGYFGLARSNNIPKHMDAVTYMKQQNEAYRNTYGYEFYTDEEIQGWPQNHANDPESYPKPNVWWNTVFETAPQQSHTLTLSGGDREKIMNRISFRYLDEDGILPNYGFKISEMRAKNDIKLSNRLTLGTNINVRLTDRNMPYNEWESYNRMWQNSQWGVPYYSDGSYGLSVDSYSPLINLHEMGTSNTKGTYLVGIFKATYKLFEGLNVSGQYSTQFNMEDRKTFNNKYDFTDKLHPERRTFNTINRMNDNRYKSKEDMLDFQLTYNNTFDQHTLSGILGYSEIHFIDNWGQGYRQNFYNNQLQALSLGANDATQSATGGNSEWGLRSYFARVNYDYDSKYLFEANARYDGSSRFADGYRYGFFPSFSMGWRLSSEDFWEPIKPVINEFKLRGSWGEVGSQQVGLYSFMPTYNQMNYVFNETLAPGYRQVNLANQNISWETTAQLNFGVDGYLFNNLLNFSFDYYKKTTRDILLLVPIPSVVGLEPTNQNAGSVENKGVEFLVQAHRTFGDFGVDLGFNVNYNQNKVLDLAGTGPHISAFGNSDYRTITVEGQPINSFYGFTTDGFFKNQADVDNYAKWDGSVGPGDIKYVDQNMDGELTPDDFVIFGKEIPDWTFSSNMAVSWKNFRLDLFWQGVSGSEKIMTGAIMEHGIWGGFTHEIYSDYWTPTNMGARYPRPTKYTMKNAQISDFWMVDGNYLRLKNIRLSYDIPQGLTERINVGGITVYASATNLLTFSELNKYSIDPEMEGRGQESSFPQTSVTTFGININF